MVATEEFSASAGPAAGRGATPPSRLAAEDEAEIMRELMQFEVTEEQARELFRILVWMMGFFVEHGFSGDICGQIFEGLLTADSADSRSAKMDFAAANAEGEATEKNLS